MKDLLECLYDGLEHGVETLVAHVPKDPEGGDGQPVDVFVTALPAKFYTIRARASVNSIGEPVPAFTLSTGSDMDKLVSQIAKAISQGMLGLKQEDPC